MPARTVIVVQGSPMPLDAVTAYADNDPDKLVSIVSAGILSKWGDTDAGVFTGPQCQLLGLLLDQALPAYPPEGLSTRGGRWWARPGEVRVQQPWARRARCPGRSATRR